MADRDLADPILLELANYLEIDKQTRVTKRGRARGLSKNTVDVKPKKPPRVAKDSKLREKKAVETKPPVKRVRSRVKREKKCPAKVPELLNCGLCHQTFQSKEKLGLHIESHEGESSCQICGEKLPGAWEMALAHRYSHVELKRGMLECHLCGYRYATRVAFESHYVVHHIRKQTKDFACIYCFKPYPDRRKLQKHMAQHSEREYICDYCKKSYNCKSKLRVHMLSHSTDMTFQCEQCPKRFRWYSNLISHRTAHTPGRVYCSTCRRHFPDERRLRAHTCRAPKQCNICGKLILKSGRLRTHLLVHSNERPYKCERCPASFKGLTALRAHQNRHDNIRPHSCPHCDRTFFTGCVLKKHIAWIHTGERSHVCKVCGKGFAAAHNLRVHMRVHGEYLIQSKKDQLANGGQPDTS